jgi:hypothetical protein
VFCGEWSIGRIYQNHSGPYSLRWFWALHAADEKLCAHQIRSQPWKWRRPSFEASWIAWKAWTGLEEVS